MQTSEAPATAGAPVIKEEKDLDMMLKLPSLSQAQSAAQSDEFNELGWPLS